jgi:hypothetical protein
MTELLYMDGEMMERSIDQRNVLSVRQALARSCSLDLSARAKNWTKIQPPLPAAILSAGRQGVCTS